MLLEALDVAHARRLVRRSADDDLVRRTLYLVHVVKAVVLRGEKNVRSAAHLVLLAALPAFNRMRVGTHRGRTDR